MQQKSTNQYF